MLRTSAGYCDHTGFSHVTPDDESHVGATPTAWSDLSNLFAASASPTMRSVMSLISLLVCADDHAIDVLSRILGDLSIKVETSGNAASALGRLAAQSFDAVLIDCKDERAGVDLISKVRYTPPNRSALVIALVDGQNHVRDLFARGANFVLYKPVSSERAAASLRAAKTLMRRERRQKPRAAVHAQAAMAYAGVEDIPATLLDLSENGIAIQCDRKLPPSCKVYFQFSLPGYVSTVRLSGEIMWQDSTGRVGLRFVDVPQTSRRVLSQWLQNSLTNEQCNAELPPKVQDQTTAPAGLGLLSVSAADRRIRARHACRLSADVYRLGSNVPQRCFLSDISSGGCYVETTDPFPASTAVDIVVRARDMKIRVCGKVQTTHRGFGMGVHFDLKTAQERDQVQQLIALVAQYQSSAGSVSAEPWLR